MIRHASRVPGPDNPSLPLSPEGEEECRRLAAKLVQERLIPVHYMSSRHSHATRTAELLRQFIGSSATSVAVTPLATLTPGCEFTPEKIFLEAKMRGADLRSPDCIAWILHHPRFQQLISQMTSQPEAGTKPQGAEAACLEAEDIDAFVGGTAVECQRIVSSTTSQPRFTR